MSRAPRFTFVNMLVLVAFGWLAILLEVAPLGARAGAPPAPDLLFCVAGALALRRPSATPAVIVLLLGLVRDLVGGGPVGLGALLLLISVEALRALTPAGRSFSFWAEIAAAACVVAVASAVEATLLTIALVSPPPLTVLGYGVASTAAAYAAVAFILSHLLRIRTEAASPAMAAGSRR